MNNPQNSKVNFIYKLGGHPQEIDVFELAPTLLALGQLIQEGNRTLYPDGRQIAVNVKPFREGSFVVDIVLFPTTNLNALLEILQQTSSEQILTVLGTLGIISTATDKLAKAGTSVLKAMRELRGKPKTIEEVKPGEFRYTSDNNSIPVTGNVHQLLQNPKITNNIYLTFGRPLEQEDIEDIESYLPSDLSTRVIVDKEDVPLLKEYASVPDRESEDDRGDEKLLTNVYLNPKRGAYDGDGKSWSFHRGGSVITATIRDKNFLQKVRSGEIRPHYADLMTVTMIEKQKVVGTRVKAVTYEILSVDQYEIGGKQMELSPGSGSKLLSPLSAEDIKDLSRLRLPPASESDDE